MNKILLLALFVLPTTIFAQRELHFVSENIDFELNKKTFSINGIYYFSNSAQNEIERTILFPFSKNADSLKIIRVYNLSYLKNIKYIQQNDAISFSIKIRPKDTIKVNISYTQRTDIENIYILKSTQAWGEALKNASYSLTIDSSVSLDSLSLEPDELKGNTYYWKKENFYPNENFKILIK